MVYENVTGKQRGPYPFLAIFPSAEDLTHRQKDLNASFRQLSQHLLFKAASGIKRIPRGFPQQIFIGPFRIQFGIWNCIPLLDHDFQRLTGGAYERNPQFVIRDIASIFVQRHT